MRHTEQVHYTSLQEEVSFEAALDSFAVGEPGLALSRNNSSLLPCGDSGSAWDQEPFSSGLDDLLEQDAAPFEILAAAGTSCSSSFEEDWTMVEPEPVANVLDAPAPTSAWEVDSLLAIHEPSSPDSDDSDSRLSRTSTPNPSEGSVSPRPVSEPHSPSTTATASANLKTEEEKSEPVARTRGGKPRSRKNKKPFYWTAEDHKKFLAGLQKFGLHDSLGPGGAELVAMFMGNRTPLQVRSHAQKYFSELGLAR